MIESILHHQLEWMVGLSEHRTLFWNLFFRFCNYFDTDYFYFVMVPIVWLGFSWKWGARVYYLMLINYLINYWIKMIFMLPRPFVAHPGLNLIEMGGWSFPSGAAQGAMLFGGLLIYNFKSVWVRTIGVIYIITIGFSRVYLGVHYPSDVVVGWAMGFIVLLLFLWIYPLVEKGLKKVGFSWTVVLILIIPFILLLLFYDNHRMLRIMSSAVGIGIGLSFATPFKLVLPIPKRNWEKIARSMVGIIGIFFLYLALKTLFIQSDYLSLIVPSFLLGIWLSLFASLFCKILLKKYVVR